MPRLSVDLIQGKVFISPSQEDILRTIPGWDDAEEGFRIIDETPCERPYPEDSSQSSLHRVFDVTGSSLSEPSQEAVEWASPDASPIAGNATIREDTFNEAFESDRSQSPSKKMSWNLAHGNDPKLPTSIDAKEFEVPELDIRTVSSLTYMRDALESRIPPGVLAENICDRDISNIELGCTQFPLPLQSMKSAIDVVTLQSDPNPGCDATSCPEDDRVQILARPPRVIQEKLDKLRSLGAKRVCVDNVDARDNLKDGDRFIQAHFLPSSVLDVVRLRSGDKLETGITAAELLNSALDVGVCLPPPFNRSYFRPKLSQSL